MRRLYIALPVVPMLACLCLGVVPVRATLAAGLPKLGRTVTGRTVAWVHAPSIQLADFDGDGHLDICYAEQDQASLRRDGKPGRMLGVFGHDRLPGILTSLHGYFSGANLLVLWRNLGRASANSDMAAAGDAHFPPGRTSWWAMNYRTPSRLGRLDRRGDRPSSWKRPTPSSSMHE
jgi:hypothetical protein